ncbi:MAG TPA: hypothetical protein VFH95_09005 [Candidatus Kapabacteria bacterium]|nr:hypothetical protein [Candidatus Kapabacteria bacterium]
MIPKQITSYVLLAIGAFACYALASCTGTTNPSPNNPDTTKTSSDTVYLLHNANFDSTGGGHSFNGWTFNKVFDTVDFEQDAPSGGGTWGFKLHSVDFGPVSNNITRDFTGLDSGVYAFTVWSHSKYVYPNTVCLPGWMGITRERGGVKDTVMQYLTNSQFWQPETMLDTLALLPADTVTLEVSAGIAVTHGNPVTVDEFTFAKYPR